MKRLLAVLITLHVWSAALGLAGEAAPGQWIVVSAPAFRTAIEPLCAQRKAEGFHVVVVPTTDVLSAEDVRKGRAELLRDHIHKLCRQSKGTSYVLLVGSAQAGAGAAADKVVVPPLRGTVGRMKGQPSDNGYGCLDRELLPALAVGRMPARTETEARQMVQKTLAFERDARPGPWRRRISMLVGNPGGASTAERLGAELYVENACLSRVDKLDPAWSVRALLHFPQSRFGVPDNELHERAVQYLRDGDAFAVYLGHSSAAGFWSQGVRFLNREDWATLALGQAIFVTCGCFGCQLSGPDGEGYGVAAMRNPRGPVAVIGAHGESYSAMGQLAFDGLARSFTKADLPERLGACWLDLKAGLAKGPIDFLTFRLMDNADGSRGTIPLAVQRQEHLQMWLLLGDPALRLPVLPKDIQLTVADAVAPGTILTVQGMLPRRLAGARVQVAVERPLSGRPIDPEVSPEQPAPARAQATLARHDRANRVDLVRQEVAPREYRFESRLRLPDKLPWPRIIVRVYAATQTAEGLGVRVLLVSAKEPP
jgi:hypothetical protein